MIPKCSSTFRHFPYESGSQLSLYIIITWDWNLKSTYMKVSYQNFKIGIFRGQITGISIF